MQKQTQRPPNGSSSQLIIDLGPVAVFVVAYNALLRMPAYKDNAVYIATGVFVVATLGAILYCLWKQGRIPPVLIVTGVIVTAFGGLTIALHDDTFIKLKPTVANLFYAAAIIGSLLVGENILKLLFKHIFTLPDRIWTVLALRWGAAFAGLAIVNEVMRQTLTTSDWVSWHFPVLMAGMIAFALANTPLIIKHHIEDEAPASSAAPD